MRTIFVTLALAAMACGCIALSTPSADENAVQLIISSDQATFQLSSPPVLTITLANHSDTRITVVVTNPYLDYELSCLDGRGTPVALTEYGRTLKGPHPFDARATVIIEPGDKTEVKINLAKIFNFTMPGQYSVSAKRTFYNGEPGPRSSVVSNTFPFSLAN